MSLDLKWLQNERKEIFRNSKLQLVYKAQVLVCHAASHRPGLCWEFLTRNHIVTGGGTLTIIPMSLRLDLSMTFKVQSAYTLINILNSIFIFRKEVKYTLVICEVLEILLMSKGGNNSRCEEIKSLLICARCLLPLVRLEKKLYFTFSPTIINPAPVQGS